MKSLYHNFMIAQSFLCSFTPLKNLSYLTLEWNNLTLPRNFPTQCSESMPGLLKYLSLKGNPLTVLERNFLQQFAETSLETLNLESCQLKILEEGIL